MSGAYQTPQELLARLVAFDTTSHKSNLPLIAYIEGILAEHGIASQRVANEDGTKTSVFATIGPQDKSGIGLSGHTDTVPVQGQQWNSHPFSLTRRGNKLYGRGTSDMKGFLACMLAVVPDLITRPLKTPIHLIFSYDEEIGCMGVRPLVAELGRSLPRPRLVIVGEPTSMQVVDAHKGIHAFQTTVTGREAHSSMPHLGVNAVAYAAELVAELSRIDEEMRQRADGPRFTPPYTTVHVGRIEGGVQRNIVPKQCRFIWEFRRVPATDPEEIPQRLETFAREKMLPAMRTVDAGAGIETQPVSHVPGLEPGDGSDAVLLALKLAGQNQTHAVSYGTEAGLFAGGGCPAVVCGPGDITQAHAPDEFIAEAQLEDCMRFLERLADQACQDSRASSPGPDTG